MSEGPDIARLASLLADPARSSMLTALLAIPALTARELAEVAGVAAPTASGHLQMMLSSRLLEVTAQGRHRYYRLADERVGQLLEHMLGFADSLGFTRTRVGPRDAALRLARTCYDHMAGEIAVRLFARMKDNGLVAGAAHSLSLTEQGLRTFSAFGISSEALRSRGRPACRPCLDWSERREHLAGRAGAALLDRIIEIGWATRAGRTLKLTTAGAKGLDALFLDDPNRQRR